MTKVMKKFGAVTLALALMVSMLPFVSASAFAASEEPSVDHIEVTLNGSAGDPDCVLGYLDRQWLVANEIVQAFPFASKKNLGAIKYKVFKGVDLEKVFAQFGLTEAQLEGATIYLCEDGYKAKNPLKVDHLVISTKVMKGKWDVDQNKDGRTYVENAEVVPVLATGVSSQTYNSYEDAVAALNKTGEDTFWSDAAKTSLAVGNSGEPYWALSTKEGEENYIDEANNGAIDCCARYGINNFVRMNIVTADPEDLTLDKDALVFKSTASQKITASASPASAELAVKWTSSNDKVATVDKAGNVTPVGFGKCTITASCESSEKTVEKTASVTVNKSDFTPAKVTGFKAKNVKKKTAKLSWKKVPGANGYTVSYKKKGAKKWKTKTTAKTSMNIKKLARGKKYVFKVSANRNVFGQNVSGANSVSKTIKIKK